MANHGLLSYRHAEMFWHTKGKFRNTTRSCKKVSLLVTLTSCSDSNFERSHISLKENKRGGVDSNSNGFDYCVRKSEGKFYGFRQTVLFLERGFLHRGLLSLKGLCRFENQQATCWQIDIYVGLLKRFLNSNCIKNSIWPCYIRIHSLLNWSKQCIATIDNFARDIPGDSWEWPKCLSCQSENCRK